MNYDIKFSNSAEEELQEAFNYINTEKQAPMNAKKWLEGMMEVIYNLSKFPKSNALARENDSFQQELRQVIFKSYRIVYEVQEHKIHIHHITHVARKINTDPRLLP